MAKQMKQALCILLSVLMAVSCFSISAFAYTGYDHNGSQNDLRVQAAVSTDKASYSVGETVSATITLNHPDDAIMAFQGYLAFDSSKLEFKSVALSSGFIFYDDSTESSSIPVAEVNPTALHNGMSGAAYTVGSFSRLVGIPTVSANALALAEITALNLTGVPAGSDAVATVTFEAKAAVDSIGVGLVPSNVYSTATGYLDCVATTSTENVLSSAYCAVSPSSAFEITGSSGGDVYYTITFSWHDGSTDVSTKANDMPVAPTVPGYSEGDYDYTFSTWSPALAKATAAQTYVAQYSSVFVAADYDAYNAAVAAAIAKRNNGTNWTEDSVAALNAELDKDVSGKGRTAQSEVDAQTAAINAAAEALAEKAAVYTINFVVKGDTVSTQQVTVGVMPSVPTVLDYEDDAKKYTFTGWDKEIVAAAGDTTYIAQFSETWKEYDITFKWTTADGEKQEVVKTHWGELPVAPTVGNYQTASSTFRFDGWEPAIAECAGATTYVAKFTETEKTFTVKFVNENGDILQSEDLVYGATPVYKGETPTKAADNTYTYTFDGWDKEIAAVTEDVTYTATYKESFIEYTVKFVDEDGTTVLNEATYHYNETPVVPSQPSKAADNTYTYAFDGWDKEITAVTEDVTYTATYKATYIDYTIKFVWEGGSQEVTVHWNDVPEEPTVPSYEQGGKTYSFNGWDQTVIPCAGDAIYTATYTSEFIIYNITFIVGDLQNTQQVNAGSMPIVAQPSDYDDGDWHVTFTGWDKEIVPAAGDTTYTAQFSRTFVSADYSTLRAAQAAAAEVNRDIYTAESLAALDTALSAVQEGLGRTQQELVDSWADAINTAISELAEKPADYSAYEAAVSALNAELAKDTYTPDSIDSVAAKLAAIDNALDKELKITAQSTVDEAVAAVNALQSELVEKADKGDLKSLIDEAKALDSDKYVDFSAVTTALAEAEAVYADENATPSAVSNAIRALRNAINGLEKKAADYSAWEALKQNYDNIAKDYYTPESVAAVEAVLAKIQENQDIEYQSELNALVEELNAAINALEITSKWAGELDFNGVDHEWFHSNLELVQEIDSEDATNIVVKVYLNHPVNTADGIQLALLYDAQAMSFKSADINGGTLVGTNAKDASFNPADYGLDAMAKASILKVVADFDTPLAPSEASRDLIATLHFTATGAANASYIKAVPLASNNTADASNYSMFTEGDNEVFMHNDAAALVLAEVESGTVTGTLSGDNNTADVTVELKNGEQTVDTKTVKGENAVYTFENVLPGTYTLIISAPGSLGYTIQNVVVTAANTTDAGSVKLLYGDADGDGVITAVDVGLIINNMSEDYDILYDPDGDGFVTAQDIGLVLLEDHFGVQATDQVIVLPN